MGGIVCATRGGQGSRAAQLRAIKQAQASGVSLTFLYVVDITVLGDFDATLEPAVRSEFNWLARALLHIAQQRAAQAGIDAQMVIREGQVKEEIERFLRESEASLLLLGAPRGTTRTVFGDDAIERFAEEIAHESGVQVEVVRPDEFFAKLAAEDNPPNQA